jgi:polyisoprenoid-binding protein YceI
MLPLILSSVALAGAATKTFKVVGERLEYRNLATVESETEFETFTGKTTKVSGSIDFDVAKKTGNGTIIVDVASIDTGIALRNDHMRSANWLDAEKYPTIKFVATKVKAAGQDQYTVSGKLTIKGVTKDVITKVRLKYKPFSEDVKTAGFSGDVVQLYTKFSIKLSDYGVVIPAPAKGKVSDKVELTVSAYAVAN